MLFMHVIYALLHYTPYSTILFICLFLLFFVYYRQALICKLCKAVNKPDRAQLR